MWELPVHKSHVVASLSTRTLCSPCRRVQDPVEVRRLILEHCGHTNLTLMSHNVRVHYTHTVAACKAGEMGALLAHKSYVTVPLCKKTLCSPCCRVQGWVDERVPPATWRGSRRGHPAAHSPCMRWSPPCRRITWHWSLIPRPPPPLGLM